MISLVMHPRPSKLRSEQPTDNNSDSHVNCTINPLPFVFLREPGVAEVTMSGLRILVPVKRVIDYAVSLLPHYPNPRYNSLTHFTPKTTAQATNAELTIALQVKPRVNRAQTAIETANVKHSMNPFDELSIEAAVRLRETNKKSPSSSSPAVADILAFTAGPPKAQDILRTAMAMGADRAIHVQVDELAALEPLGVAKLLQKVVEKEKSNLVILGKQSIDDDAAQTGQMLAGLLNWPQATQASAITIEDETVTVVKEVDGGVETVRAKLPMVITTDLRLNEPRYASLPNIMKAKKKPLEKKTLADYELDVGTRLKTVKVAEPEARKGGVKVEDVDGMIAKLKELGAL
jgi:electron transfer flavoprotein beta subunit